jgi:hypothetical protein
MLGVRLQRRELLLLLLCAGRLDRVQLGLVALAVVHEIGGSCQLFLSAFHL